MVCQLWWTAQMEGMVLDLSLAKEKQQNFEAWQRQEGRSLPIEMTVQVLTTGFWPQYKVRPPHSPASSPPGSLTVCGAAYAACTDLAAGTNVQRSVCSLHSIRLCMHPPYAAAAESGPIAGPVMCLSRPWTSRCPRRWSMASPCSRCALQYPGHEQLIEIWCSGPILNGQPCRASSPSRVMLKRALVTPIVQVVRWVGYREPNATEPACMLQARSGNSGTVQSPS